MLDTELAAADRPGTTLKELRRTSRGDHAPVRIATERCLYGGSVRHRRPRQ
jgi:hypothetical protein